MAQGREEWKEGDARKGGERMIKTVEGRGCGNSATVRNEW